MKHRHCGIDLNGRRDLALRNWTIGADGEESEQKFQIHGGIFGSLVRVGDASNPKWIGGFQSELAPHGRGPGWGEVGRIERRTSLRSVLDQTEPNVDLLRAAIEGLGKGASHAVMAIDDTAEATEVRQDLLLSAMHRAGLRQRLLVWRPVLAILSVLQDQDLSEGSSVGIINHTKDGLGIQMLRIRRETGRTRTILAPERRSAGLLAQSEVGYAGLERLAEKAISAIFEEMPTTEAPRALGLLALGLEAEPEVLRTERGRWVRLAPPKGIATPTVALSKEAKECLHSCDLVLFETLVEGRLRTEISSRLSNILDREIIGLSPNCVAMGALEAAERMSRDEPVYFDFLPQISTIVSSSTDREPMNFDLIDPDATLAAGRIYRSPKPAKLGLDKGQDRLTIYLKKEMVEWPRKAEIDLGTIVNSAAPVDLFVEQSPLSGSARIVLRSPALSRQHTVDWQAAEEVRHDWASLIKELETPAPTIPERLILPCGMEPWEGSNRAEGLLSLLDRYDGARSVDWDSLAARMASRPNGMFCISSDGNLPPDVPEHSVKKLKRLTERAVDEELSRLAKQKDKDNARLRFLLWQFRRCPDVIVKYLLPVISDRDAWRGLFPHWKHWQMVLQGLGRCAATPQIEQATMKAVLSRPRSTWQWWGENACLSFLLSRSDTAVQFLNRRHVEMIAKAALDDFEANVGTDYTRFFYAPFLMVGLLRWRQVERRSLIEGQDAIADDFGFMVRKTLPDIDRRAQTIGNLRKYVRLLEQVLDELRGEGSNPELLLDLFGRSEEPV